MFIYFNLIVSLKISRIILFSVQNDESGPDNEDSLRGCLSTSMQQLIYSSISRRIYTSSKVGQVGLKK